MILTIQDVGLCKASMIYQQLQQSHPQILRTEKVKGFRSFVKIIGSFDKIEPIGSGIKRYTIKK